jgi:hypothetical protein
VPEQERLAGRVRSVDEVERACEQVVFDRLHPLSRQRARVLDDLLADAAEACVLRRVVVVRSLAVKHSARLEELHRRLVARVVGLLGLLLGVQVVEVAVELVEPVHGRQELIAVAQMVLADLGGHVPLRLEQLGQRRILRLDALRRTRHAHGGQTRAHRQLPRDQRRTASRAARLGIAVG